MNDLQAFIKSKKLSQVEFSQKTGINSRILNNKLILSDLNIDRIALYHHVQNRNLLFFLVCFAGAIFMVLNSFSMATKSGNPYPSFKLLS